MKPIVVGLHPSRPVSPALDWALAEAQSRQRPLELRIARGVPVPAQADVPIDTRLPDSLTAEIIEQASSHVAGIDASLHVSGRAANGSGGAVLVAASREAELVVVGRHGHSRLVEAFSGSTSAQVAAHAQCPVVVVNDDQMPPRARSPVVVGVDGSSANRAAIEFSFETADRRGVPLVAVYAWELDMPENVVLPWLSKGAMHDLVDSQKRLLYEAMSGWAGRFPQVEVHYVVSRQHAVDRLCQEARTAGLLVVGGRGRGGFSGLLLGSVSRGILHQPHRCPVVIVHGAHPDPDV